MTVKLIKKTEFEGINEYQCATTDAEGTYPTALDCGPGSTLTIINETTHAVVGGKYFDGTNWNTI